MGPEMCKRLKVSGPQSSPRYHLPSLSRLLDRSYHLRTSLERKFGDQIQGFYRRRIPKSVPFSVEGLLSLEDIDLNLRLAGRCVDFGSVVLVLRVWTN
jgi:hypothetical protein